MRHAVKLFAVIAIGLIWTAQAQGQIQTQAQTQAQTQTQTQTQTADDVIEKHLAAMGGRVALAKLTSQVSTGTVVVSAQGVDLSGQSEIYRKAPNKARTLIKLDLTALGGTEVIIDQRCDGKAAFVSNSMQGDREITGNQLQGMLNATFPSPLLNYKDAGAKIELVGTDKVGDRAVFVLQYTPKAGPSSRQFYDAETYLLLRAVAKVDIPEAGGQLEQTTDVRDYRDIGGVKVPFSITAVNAAQTVTISLAKVELNKPIDDSMFSRPDVK